MYVIMIGPKGEGQSRDKRLVEQCGIELRVLNLCSFQKCDIELSSEFSWLSHRHFPVRASTSIYAYNHTVLVNRTSIIYCWPRKLFDLY